MDKAVTLNIAGIPIRIVGEDVIPYLQMISGMNLFVDESHIDDFFEVRFGKHPYSGMVYDKLDEFMLADDYAKCFFGKQGDRYVFEMQPTQEGLMNFVMVYDGKRHFECTVIEDVTMLRFALWMAYCMSGLNMRRTPIHSSTIEYHGRAVLFLGESGTGKSTHTRLWLNNIEGARLLNDDSPIVTCVGDRVLVSGSPWSGKTHCYHNLTFPLAAIVRLEQAKQNEMSRLDVLNAVAAVQPSLPPALAYDDYYADRMMDMVSQMVGYVPVYRLRCLPNAEAARLSFETIMK